MLLPVFPNLLLRFLSLSWICAVESAPATQSNDTKSPQLTPSEETTHAAVPSIPESTLDPQINLLRESLLSTLNNPNTSLAAMKTIASALDASRKQSSSSQGLPSLTPGEKSTSQSPSTGSGEKILRVGESMHAPELPTSSHANE